MTRKPPKGKSLAEVNPELAKEWHPSKNDSLSPFDVTIGSGKKIWWKCDKGDDHIWYSMVRDRSRGSGCPICAGQKVVLSNCLATLNPELAKQWHPNKNEKLTPYDVTGNSGKKVWWKCDKEDDHEWESSISGRSRGSGCPICAGQKVVLSNCLATLNPELAKQWHPNKNEKLTPYDVTGNSGKKVWWKCDKDNDHDWKTSIDKRTNGSGCPICIGQKVVLSNSLAILNPKLAKEWHPTKNNKLTPYDVTIGSNKKVWWKCNKGDDHEWNATVSDRSNNGGCSVCRGLKVVLSNSLATLNPELAKEWHPIKNGKLTPYDVVLNSHKKVWWKCDKGDDHVWISSIVNRSFHGRACPVCVGKKVVLSNCLANLNPELARQWHLTKNGKLTPYDVTISSGIKVWWKCDKGDDHEWKTSVNNRSNNRFCPYCTLTPQSKQELTITFELIQFFKINPKGFKTRVQGKLTSIDIFISELKLGIEFDGSYWHKGKREFDKLKTEKLEFEGFKIMRVREEPLKAITDIDVISKQPFNAKAVTNEILTHIMATYTLEPKKIKRIEKYLLKEEIQNEKRLDAYIEMILIEKAEKKNP